MDRTLHRGLLCLARVRSPRLKPGRSGRQGDCPYRLVVVGHPGACKFPSGSRRRSGSSSLVENRVGAREQSLRIRGEVPGRRLHAFWPTTPQVSIVPLIQK